MPRCLAHTQGSKDLFSLKMSMCEALTLLFSRIVPH